MTARTITDTRFRHLSVKIRSALSRFKAQEKRSVITKIKALRQQYRDAVEIGVTSLEQFESALSDEHKTTLALVRDTARRVRLTASNARKHRERTGA